MENLSSCKNPTEHTVINDHCLRPYYFQGNYLEFTTLNVVINVMSVFLFKFFYCYSQKGRCMENVFVVFVNQYKWIGYKKKSFISHLKY